MLKDNFASHKKLNSMVFRFNGFDFMHDNNNNDNIINNNNFQNFYYEGCDITVISYNYYHPSTVLLMVYYILIQNFSH